MTLISGIFGILEGKTPDYIKVLIEYLDNSKIISKGRMEILKSGITAYGNGDYISAFHVLVFQIEGILRDLLERLGTLTFSYRANEMREIMLKDILSNLSNIRGIDSDLLKFTEVLLCRIEGDNYRNDAAHGLLPVEAFTKENCQLLLIILIKLAPYSIVKHEEAETS